MNLLFYIIWLIWFLSEVFLNRFFQSKSKNSKALDQSSLWVIWITISVSMFLGNFINSFYQFSLLNYSWFNYLGLLVITIGIVIRFIAIYTLGKFFTVNLAVHKHQKVVQTGLYRFVRHPSYSGSLVSFLGFGLSLNNWVSLLIIFIPVLLSFINRIFIEEKLLKENIGADYIAYCKKTYRLIPFLY
jgi:protein-S-isoprenylcysteine O-methyltransferase Ste14